MNYYLVSDYLHQKIKISIICFIFALMFNTEEYFDDVLPFIKDGKVDKSAPLTWYRLNSDFNLPVGRMSAIANIHGDTPHWSLSEGEIIAFGSIPYQDTDREIKRSNIVIRGDEIQFINNTRKFFDINHKLFVNITLHISRDNKINQLI